MISLVFGEFIFENFRKLIYLKISFKLIENLVIFTYFFYRRFCRNINSNSCFGRRCMGFKLQHCLHILKWGNIRRGQHWDWTTSQVSVRVSTTFKGTRYQSHFHGFTSCNFISIISRLFWFQVILIKQVPISHFSPGMGFRRDLIITSQYIMWVIFPYYLNLKIIINKTTKYTLFFFKILFNTRY